MSAVSLPQTISIAVGAGLSLLVDFRVGSRADLTPWLAWLDELGVEHTGIRDLAEPFVYSTVVFRDPDNNQLELIALG